MGHQGTLGIATEATLELVKRPEAEFSAFFAYPSYMDAWKATGELARCGAATLAGVVLFDEWKVALPAPRRRGLHPAAGLGEGGRRRRDVRKRRRGAALGEAHAAHRQGARAARYLGDEISQGDWASRHDRYATPLHGRSRDGQVALMSWHCEDASHPLLPAPRRPREVACDCRRPPRALRHVRRLGHVRLHERGLQAVGRLPDRDRHRHLGDEVGRRELGGLGGRQARDRPRRHRARRLDLRLPRLVPRGRGRPRPRASWAAAAR